MVVGKTLSSMSKTEIFSQYSEAEVLSTVFPNITSIPCVIQSPLRVDNHPSFSIYLDDNKHIKYKDYSYTEEKGSLMDLLCKYWNCTFHQALDNISKIFVEKKHITIKPKKVISFSEKDSRTSKIEVAVRPWKDYDYDYWESYGVTKRYLRYAEIYPISHKIVIKKDVSTGKAAKYVFSADKYAYCFVERKEGKTMLKIYQPFNTKGYKWCSKMDSSVVGLWTKIPQKGKRVIICSSLKDALCVTSQLNIPALCLQGEGYSMSDRAICELRERYEKVFISFDTDRAGRINSKKLAAKTGFKNIIPDLGKEKDYSDYYKSLENKEDFKKLETLFH